MRMKSAGVRVGGVKRVRERHATIGDVIRIVESAEVLSNTDGEEPRITALSLRVPREKPDASPEAAEDDEAMRAAGAYERLSRSTGIVDRIMHACIGHRNDEAFCRELIAREIESLLGEGEQR